MRIILLNICLTAIALCLFKMLIPENSMKKQADFLIACFFLASLLFFFTSGGIDFSSALTVPEGEVPYVNFEETYQKAQQRVIGIEMRNRINAVLELEGIYPEEIYTIVNISGKYSISINEIRLVLSDKEDMEILKKAIYITQKEVGDSILVSGDFIN